MNADSAQPPRVWGDVPLRNQYFVGRDDLFKELRLRLGQAGTTAVLHGMSGVGRSQTVAEYLYRYASEYEVVWWIAAERQELIHRSFVELAKRLGVAGEGVADNAVPAVLEALRRGEPYRRWILVFDNADRPQDVRRYFPAGNGHIVVTSRNSGWSGVTQPVAVNVFTREESKELLHRRAGDLDDADADALAEALGDLPLAIEQAAAWCVDTAMPVSQYLRLLEQNRTELLETGTSNDDQLPVAAAWNVPLNELADHHLAALQLLQLCAFFGPEPIPQELFYDACDAVLPDPLAAVLGDPFLLGRAVLEISRYSLAKIDHRANTLQLHRLVQTVLKNRLTAEEQDGMRHAVHVLLINGDSGDPDASTHWPRYAELLPHALASEASRCPDPRMRRFVHNLASYLDNAGDSGSARDLAEQAERSRRVLPDVQDADGVEMIRRCGAALRRSPRDADGRGRERGRGERPAQVARPNAGPSVRLGYALDVVDYSKRPWEPRKLVPRRVSELADAVLDHLGLDRGSVDSQGAGDGLMAFMTPDLNVSRVLSRLLTTWRDLLYADNQLYRDRVRVRMAVTIGPIAPAELGFTGEPVIVLGRLLDSELLRTAVTDHPDADVVVLLSDTVHSLAVDPTDPAFTRHFVEIRNYHGHVWLWIGRPPTQNR